MFNGTGGIAVTDPVCGKALDMGEVAESEMYEGWAYYFCSAVCRERFARAPARYASKHREPAVDKE